MKCKVTDAQEVSVASRKEAPVRQEASPEYEAAEGYRALLCVHPWDSHHGRGSPHHTEIALLQP